MSKPGLVLFFDYAYDKRATCYACGLSVAKGQPCYLATIGKGRQRVLHETCAHSGTGTTHLKALKRAARAYADKHK